MNLPLALVAPLALMLPLIPGIAPQEPAPAALVPAAAVPAVPPAITNETANPADTPVAAQVRIEQRVVIRIAPIGTSTRAMSLAEAAPPAEPARVTERKMGKCVPVAGIAAVQPDAGGRLLLYMRDQRLIAASLEKACSARDFYSGFYLERSRDGMLCIERDKLHSRAGASCALGKMRQLVAIND